MPQRYATIDEVRARLGPEFTDPPITDAIVQLYLDDTACFISPPAWGDCASQAHAYAAAHCIAMSPEGSGILGPGHHALTLLASEANGPASRSFAQPAQDAGDAPWNQTRWGRKFLGFLRGRRGRGSAVLARTSRTLGRAC